MSVPAGSQTGYGSRYAVQDVGLRISPNITNDFLEYDAARLITSADGNE